MQIKQVAISAVLLMLGFGMPDVGMMDMGGFDDF